MNKLNAAIIFGSGFALGGIVGAVVCKVRLEKKYKQRTEEAVRDARARYLAVVKRESPSEAMEGEGASVDNHTPPNADDIRKYREINSLNGYTPRTEANYTNYDTSQPAVTEDADISATEKNAADGERMTANAATKALPFPITAADYGEEPLYDCSPEYNYYRLNGILEDLTAGGEIVDNQEAVLGTMFNSIKDYQDDFIYLQDDAHNRYITVHVFNLAYTDYN